eukprot:CAMPEP_0198120494 /NCGR_PEP_ID=MMETSP1442-20131203/29223_1 /TAXON_ID= /ORGANISM="Craspedostauros australis, Strain CCMP3328" /LENGTH=346 /DNA_ID=CAMNT_0043779149 /DNA_START=52 /DNA_END=1092 /DNA_ORIENTATION=+
MPILKNLADVIPGLGKFTFDPSVGTVLVTNGSGLIGYRVAVRLLEAGHKDVRVGIWKGGRQGLESGYVEKIIEKLTALGASFVDFDWSDDRGFAEAVKGVKTVFCSIPHIQNWSDMFPAFIRCCKDAKVEHFVKVSFLRSKHNFKGVAEIARQYRENVPFVAFHGTCDDLLEQTKSNSRMSHTILCCSHYMATPLLIQGDLLREKQKFVTASYGMGINYVSPNDVAEAAVVVLLNMKPHRNQIYNITGPRPIKDSQVVKILSQCYGKEIEHIELGFHDYKEHVAKRGLPQWQLRDAAAWEKMKASGIDESPMGYTKDFENITGKKPETFVDYLNNKEGMRPGLVFP